MGEAGSWHPRHLGCCFKDGNEAKHGGMAVDTCLCIKNVWSTNAAWLLLKLKPMLGKAFCQFSFLLLI